MKILIVSQYFWPENFRINELVSALKVDNVEVEVLTGKPNYPTGVVFDGYRAWGCKREVHAGVPIFRVPIFPRANGIFRLALNYLSFILSGIFFGAWLIRGRRYDAIFVFGLSPIFQAIPAIWLAWLKKAPTVIWVQDLWPESLIATGYVKSNYLLHAVEFVVKWIYKQTDLLLVQSKAFIPKIQALAGKRPVTYYPNFFLEDVPSQIVPSIFCKGLDCPFPVVFAGNIGGAQAVEVVLEAAALLRGIEEIRFVMIGDGSRRTWMQQQASMKGLTNIVFAGSFPVEAMPNLMARAAVLLVTLADSEILRLTIPSKVQAYLAAGRPIIGCLSGAGAEVINEASAGITVPAEDGNALAHAVRRLYDMGESERGQMGENGRRFYEQNFTQGKLVRKLMLHLDQTVRSFKGQ